MYMVDDPRVCQKVKMRQMTYRWSVQTYMTLSIQGLKYITSSVTLSNIVPSVDQKVVSLK